MFKDLLMVEKIIDYLTTPSGLGNTLSTTLFPEFVFFSVSHKAMEA